MLPAAASVANLCRGGARRAPERTAIEWDGGEIAFATLDRRTESLARHFQDVVEPGRRVGLYCANRVEWIEAYVAAHKAGIPVVPINHRYRAGRSSTSSARRTSGSSYATTRPPTTLASRVRSTASGHWLSATTSTVRPVARPSGWSRARRRRTCSYTRPARPRFPRSRLHACYAGDLGFVPQMAVGYDPSDRFLLFTPLAHRAAQPLLLCALFRGATTRCSPSTAPPLSSSAIRDRGVTALVAVPTALRTSSGCGAPTSSGRCRASATSFSRARVSAPTARGIRSSFPNARFSSAYGSTEAGLVTFLDHEHQLEHARSCGRAVQGVEIRLVDGDGTDVRQRRAGRDPCLRWRARHVHGRRRISGARGVESFTDADGWFQQATSQRATGTASTRSSTARRT